MFVRDDAVCVSHACVCMCVCLCVCAVVYVCVCCVKGRIEGVYDVHAHTYLY